MKIVLWPLLIYHGAAIKLGESGNIREVFLTSCKIRKISENVSIIRKRKENFQEWSEEDLYHPFLTNTLHKK